MGGKLSCCCHCCSTNPRKYNPANIDETQAVTNANFSDFEPENGLETNNSKLHVSIIYGGDEEEKIPSDDPTSSTIFGQMLQQNKETSAPTSRNSKVPSFNSNSRQGELTKSSLKHSNSCSTIYIDDSTVSQPNLRAMIKCVSIAIHSHIVLRKSNKTINIFDERLHPLTKDPVPDDYDRQVPEQRNVYRFLRILFHSAQLTAECAIVALVYLERVLSYGELDLCPSNWKRLVLGAVMLASKVWDDQAVWNVDFCQILKDIRVSDMNELEREYVQLLQFNVNVGSSIYAKYYFDLRQLAKEHQISFPDELLTKEKAIKLEASSIATARSETTTNHSNPSKGTSMNIRRNPNGSATIKRSVSMELPHSSHDRNSFVRTIFAARLLLPLLFNLLVVFHPISKKK